MSSTATATCECGHYFDMLDAYRLTERRAAHQAYCAATPVRRIHDFERQAA